MALSSPRRWRPCAVDSGSFFRMTTPSSTDLSLSDALIREVDWIDPGRLAAALETRGASHISLLESGLPESPWGIWTFLAWNPSSAIEHHGLAWMDQRAGTAAGGGV